MKRRQAVNLFVCSSSSSHIKFLSQNPPQLAPYLDQEALSYYSRRRQPCLPRSNLIAADYHSCLVPLRLKSLLSGLHSDSLQNANPNQAAKQNSGFFFFSEKPQKFTDTTKNHLGRVLSIENERTIEIGHLHFLKALVPGTLFLKSCTQCF